MLSRQKVLDEDVSHNDGCASHHDIRSSCHETPPRSVPDGWSAADRMH
jgi:hypothetical protein